MLFLFDLLYCSFPCWFGLRGIGLGCWFVWFGFGFVVVLMCCCLALLCWLSSVVFVICCNSLRLVLIVVGIWWCLLCGFWVLGCY